MIEKNSDVHLSAIVAVDYSGGIGKDGGIPWKCKEDMKFFKEYTQWKTCFMGRTTFNSIEKFNKQEKERDILPKRNLIVLTSSPPAKRERNSYIKLIFVDNLEETKYHILNGDYGKKVCIMGGASLYEAFSPYYDEVAITEFEDNFDCDTFVDVNKLKFTRRESLQDIPVQTACGVRGKIKFYGKSNKCAHFPTNPYYKIIKGR
jgi:dihydrofolate reductase